MEAPRSVTRNEEFNVEQLFPLEIFNTPEKYAEFYVPVYHIRELSERNIKES